MKTYSETQGKKPFDWFKFLSRKNPSLRELVLAEKRSGDWVTCACGNTCSIIPRDWTGAPKDEKLEQFGSDFCDAITEMRYVKEEKKSIEKSRKESLAILVKIEKRSTTLIRKELDMLVGKGYDLIKRKK